MQGIPDKSVVPGSCCFGSAIAVASSAGVLFALALAPARAPGRDDAPFFGRVGVPPALGDLLGDLSEVALVIGLRAVDLTEAAELGRVIVAGARTEVIEAVEGGRRRVAVDLVEVTEGARRVAGVAAPGTAFSLPFTEAGTALAATDGVEVVRGRAVAGVRGLAVVRLAAGGRGVEAVEAREEVEGREAREGTNEGGRLVVDVAVARELAAMVSGGLEAAAFSRGLALGLAAT